MPLLAKKEQGENCIRAGTYKNSGHHRDTTGRLLEDLVEHVKELNDYLIHDGGLTSFDYVMLRYAMLCCAVDPDQK